MLENIVFCTLKLYYDVFFFLEQSECDFITVSNNSVSNTIQVTWELHDANRERELKGLCIALEKFDLTKGLLLTLDQEEEIKIDNKIISVKPVWKWLLENSF